MMKCIECGHELKDGAIFCIRCGAMQVSMDGKRIERGDDWPELEAQSDASGWRSSTDTALHSAQSKTPKRFEKEPKRNTGRIIAIVVGIVVLAAIIAYAVVSCNSSATSGSNSAAVVTTSASSTSASSASASSASASSASASSASASASSESASAAVASTTTQQATQTPEPEPEPAYVPEPEPVYTNDYYVLGDSSSRYYSRDELESMGTYDLYLARNEIYARHGRMFNRSDLQDYFNSQDWYTPIYTPAQWESMGNQLNDCEYQNALLMRDVEARRGSPYL